MHIKREIWDDGLSAILKFCDDDILQIVTGAIFFCRGQISDRMHKEDRSVLVGLREILAHLVEGVDQDRRTQIPKADVFHGDSL